MWDTQYRCELLCEDYSVVSVFVLGNSVRRVEWSVKETFVYEDYSVVSVFVLDNAVIRVECCVKGTFLDLLLWFIYYNKNITTNMLIKYI